MSTPPPSSPPNSAGPDVSVRVAWSDDAEAIAAVQLRAWRASYDGLLPAELLATEPATVAAAWRTSLTKPGDARNRVLVALERNRVVGFAITGPTGDPDRDPIADGELREFIVEPEERGKGHGSRLLQATADTMVADRFERALMWVLSTDDELRAFVADAGWSPDGAHRELDLDGAGTTVVRQVRLHTSLI